MSVTETRGASKGENGMSGRPGPESLWQGVEQLARFVEESVQDGTAAHMVEKGIWEHLLGLGRMALDHVFDQVSNGDLGQEVSLPDGGVLRRLPFPYTRPSYQSIFGPFEISSTVYGSREGQKIGWVPLDQRLGPLLPGAFLGLGPAVCRVSIASDRRSDLTQATAPPDRPIWLSSMTNTR